MAQDPRHLNQGRWRWNGRDWVPADEADATAAGGTARGLGWSPKVMIAIGAAVSLLVVGLVGLAVAARATAKPAADARLGAAQIVALSGEQVRTTDSYHLSAYSSDNGEHFAVSQQDATTVEIDDSIGGLSASLIETDGRDYANANAAFYQRYQPSLVALAGRWLIFPPDLPAGPLTQVDAFRSNLVCAMSFPVRWRLAADTQADGNPVHHVYVAQGGDRVDLYVASQGIPYLIRIKVLVTSPDVTIGYRTGHSAVSGQCNGGVGANRPGTNAHWQIDFDHWGEAVPVGVPSEPIPLVRAPSQS